MEVSETLGMVAEDKQQKLRIDCADDLRAFFDTALLRLALMNLAHKMPFVTVRPANRFICAHRLPTNPCWWKWLTKGRASRRNISKRFFSDFTAWMMPGRGLKVALDLAWPLSNGR